MQNQAMRQTVNNHKANFLSIAAREDGREHKSQKMGKQLDKLVLLRASRGLRQQDVASRVGITTSYYGMIEQGVRTPQLRIAYRLANFFNTSIEEIFFIK